MQDSLEDYIKIARKTGQDDAVRVSKETVATAQLKKECEARAMKIVEFSIEGKLRPDIFTKCLPFINQAHYQDIVEERAITKLCGYSICGKKIPDMPKKQYLISTKSNKVYDITERKNFCSNFCYKASLHLKKQIDNSPLWLRKLEDIPEYKLLHISEGGLPGEYIDQGVVKPVQDYQFTSITSFTAVSLGEMEMKERKTGNKRTSKMTFKSSKLKSTMQTIKENDIEEESPVISSTTVQENIDSKKGVKIGKKDIHHKKHCVVSLPSIEELEIEITENLQALRIEPEVEAVKPVKNKGERHKARKVSKKKSKETKQSVDLESFLKKLLGEWITLDTCIFIHGEQQVRDILTEKKLGEYFDRLNVAQLEREQQMKYREICRRLQLQEMADEKFDKVLTGYTKLHPLPDYKKLKHDTKELQLKVKSFYEGGMYEQNDRNFPENKKAEPEEGPPAVLPPVDVGSQHFLRRKIFLTSMNNSMQQLLQGLGVSAVLSVLSDVQSLVKTFNLKADNITFKPPVWNIISVALLNLLSVKDPAILTVVTDDASCDFLESFLGCVSQQELLNEVISNVSRVDQFVERYITKSEQAV